jgi:hypothetical protein
LTCHGALPSCGEKRQNAMRVVLEKVKAFNGKSNGAGKNIDSVDNPRATGCWRSMD